MGAWLFSPLELSLQYINNTTEPLRMAEVHGVLGGNEEEASGLGGHKVPGQSHALVTD